MKFDSRFLKNVIGVVLSVMLVLSLSALAREYEEGRVSRPVIMTGRLEVQFESDVSSQKLSLSGDKVSFGISTLDKSLEKIKVFNIQQMFPWRRGSDAIVGTNDMSKYYEIRFADDIDINEAIQELEANPYIRSVQPIVAMPVSVTPNDPSFSDQWGLKIINDTAAFNYEKGSQDAIVAIVDAGVLYSHPDLYDNIWINPDEDIDGDMVVMDPDDINGLDEGTNSFADDLIGYDFFNGFGGLTCWPGEDCGGWDNDPKDFNGHGTHCAGIAAAVTNNSLGVAGTAGGWGGGRWYNSGPKIMCLRAGGSAVDPDYGNEGGFIVMSSAASAIDYAAFNGADVISCSFGMSAVSALTTALIRARDSGIVVIHAAGNDNSSTGEYYDLWYPAEGKTVISVANSNQSDRKTSSSNYGYWIDIAAPGNSIYNTYSDHYVATYAYLGGTSMSAPNVAGAVALLRSHEPDITITEIKNLLYNNADEMPSEPLWLQGNFGWGRLNTYKMFDSMATAKFSAGPALIGEAPLTVDFTDESPYSPTSWNWDFGDGEYSTDQNPQHTFDSYGYYTVKLTVNDQFGTNTETLYNMVMVTADTLKIGMVSTRPDSSFVVPVYLSNRYPIGDFTFPFIIQRSNGSAPNFITFDSLVPGPGSRIDFYDRVKKQTSDNLNKRYTYLFNTNYYDDGSTVLQPGQGQIFNMYFTQTSTVTSNEILTIKDTSISSYNIGFESPINDYVPYVIDGIVTIAVCDRGDANLDGARNILDITNIIDWLYKNGIWPPDEVCGDVDANGTMNILDITYLIAYLYKGGPEPPM